MRIALAVLLAASPAFADEVMVASIANDSSVTIYRLKPTGIAKVYADISGGMTGAGWTDQTLWVLHHDGGNGRWVNKVVDGKVTDKVVIPVESWKLKAGAVLGGRLKITTRNEVWVENCLKTKGVLGAAGRTCVQGTWIRVDGAKQVVSTSEPTGIDHYRAQGAELGRPPPFPPSKPPKGYSVTLQQVVVDGIGDAQKQRKVKGAVCKGPSTSKTVPENQVDLELEMKPTRVTWLREAPAVAMIEGDAVDFSGGVEPREAAFLDCKEIVDQARWLGAGYWGLKRGEVWTIYAGDKPLGSVAGLELRAAPTKK